MRCFITTLTLLSFSVLFAQSPVNSTYDEIFKKSVVQYDKGKFSKVPKKLKKLRKKDYIKKYGADSSVLGLALIHEAFAFAALNEDEWVEENITDGLRILSDYKDSNLYAYFEGHLRVVDLYSYLGNYKKAAAMLETIEASSGDLEEGSMLSMELEIRKLVNRIDNGLYTNNDEELQELSQNWSGLFDFIEGGYVPTKVDVAYRKDLLAKLEVKRVETQIKTGDYYVANEAYKQDKRKILSLTTSESMNYALFEYLHLLRTMQSEDTKRAVRQAKKFVDDVHPAFYEQYADMSVNAYINDGDVEGAEAIHKDLVKKLKKAKGNPRYFSAKRDFADLMYARRVEPYDFLDVLNDLNVDDPFREVVLEEAIAVIMFSGDVALYPEAEQFYKGLQDHYNARYLEKALPHDILKVRFAGHYLNNSTDPKPAFQLLKNRPFERIVNQLKPTHYQYASLIDELEEYFTLSGEYEYPIATKKAAIEVLRSNEVGKEELGNELISLSKFQILAGQYEEAELNIEEGSKLVRKGGDKQSESYITALNTEALLNAEMGNYYRAKQLLNRSNKILKKLDGNVFELQLANIEDVASVYTAIGKYGETEELLQELIYNKVDAYGENSFQLINPYVAIGELYVIKGDFPQATKHLYDAMDLIEENYGDSSLLYANGLSKLVLLDLKLGVYKDALVHANEVRDILESRLDESHIRLSKIYNLLGKVYFESGLNQEEAGNFYNKSLEIIAHNFGNDHPLYAEVLKNLAYVKIKEKDYDEALRDLELADEIWSGRVASKNVGSAEATRLEGDIYSYRGEFKEAKKAYEKSANVFRRLFSESHPEYLSTLSRLARSYFIEGDIKRVEDLLDETTSAYLDYTKNYFSTLSEDEKAKFWAKIKPDFEFYNTVALRYAELKPKYLENLYDNAVATKGLLLNSSVKTRNAILSSGDEELIALFEQWLDNKELLTNSLAQSSEDEGEEETVNVDAIKKETEDIERQLSELSDDFANSFRYKEYDWKDVSKSLEKNEAAIELVRYREFDQKFNEEKVRYIALIVTAETNRNPLVVKLENGNDLEGRFFQLYRNTVKFKRKLALSYESYWKPIEEAIPDKNIVYISPDGIYNQLNIESLYVGDDQYVIDRQNIRVVNSTKSLPIERSRKARKQRVEMERTALLVGNPDYYEDDSNEVISAAENSRSTGTGMGYIPQLPGTEQEVSTIAELLKANNWEIDYLMGKDADEDNIKQYQNKGLIHIATHGFFDDSKKEEEDELLAFLSDENPLDKSGLLAQGAGDLLLKYTSNYNAGDGILTASEAMNMNFDKTDLIILSACETGRGEVVNGEGVFGLQRSFIVAGADAMIMSLFKVSDETTKQLMIEFYKNWLAGDDKRTAFNKAQLAVKETYKDPIYWGAFVMVAKS